MQRADWDEQIAAFWATADGAPAARLLDDMSRLVDQRRADDPEAIYEWASVHDFLGAEDQAIPLYRKALDLGLSGERRPQAIVQLASSLRNAGQPGAAVELLTDAELDEATSPGAQAFLALALRDCGRFDEALQVSLTALARTLPLYRTPVEEYARALVNG